MLLACAVVVLQLQKQLVDERRAAKDKLRQMKAASDAGTSALEDQVQQKEREIELKEVIIFKEKEKVGVLEVEKKQQEESLDDAGSECEEVMSRLSSLQNLPNKTKQGARLSTPCIHRMGIPSSNWHTR